MSCLANNIQSAQKNEEKDATSAGCAGRPSFFAIPRMERSDTSQGRGGDALRLPGRQQLALPIV